MEINIRLEKKTNSNCYVNKLGFLYPICIYNRYQFTEAVGILQRHPSFGKPARQYHFTFLGGVLGVKHYLYKDEDIKNLKWYAGTRKWNDKRAVQRNLWLVFKTEKDRSLATLLLS